MKKKLKINISGKTDLSYHLATIVDENTLPWFYERFINTAMFGDEGFIAFDFTDNKTDESYRNIMEERAVYTYDELMKTDVIEFIREKINKNFYLYTWVDKHYVIGNDRYKTGHFIHPVMIYGYDDEEEAFYCVDLNFNSGVQTNTIRYDIVYSAIKDIVVDTETNGGNETTLDNAVIIHKLINTAYVKPFDLNIYLSELHDYLHSCINPYKFKESALYYKNIVYGIAVYDRFIEVAGKLGKDYYLPFKSLSDFMLHKKYMYDRLLYIKDSYMLGEKGDRFVGEYSGICDEMNALRSLNLKYNVIDGKLPASFSHNPRFLRKLADTLSSVRDKEVQVLTDLYEIFTYGIDRKDDSGKIISGFDILYEKNNGFREDVKILFDKEVTVEKIRISEASEISNMIPQYEIYLDNERVQVDSTRFGLNRYIDISIKPKQIKELVYREKEKAYGSTGDLGFRVYTVSDSYLWNWKLNAYINCKAELIWNNNSSVRLNIHNSDPYIIHSISSYFDSSKAKYIRIRYKTDSDSEIAQLYFKTDEHGIFDRTTTKYFTVATNGEFFEYIIDMSDVETWKGLVGMVRIDPISYDTKPQEAACDIDYIKISSELPHYNSIGDYLCTQGVHGWFYYSYDLNISYREMKWNENDGEYQFDKVRDKLFIPKNYQSSFGNIASVRRWVCPADGTYKVSYKMKQTTESADTYFILRKYIDVIEYYKSAEYMDHEITASKEFALKRGEYISFEYCSENFRGVDVVDISIDIQKLE